MRLDSALYLATRLTIYLWEQHIDLFLLAQRKSPFLCSLVKYQSCSAPYHPPPAAERLPTMWGLSNNR
jgi:hypothetical protein